VVSEGYDQNGEIQTNISGVLPGGNSLNPITAGSFTNSFAYSDTKNTDIFSDAYQGRSTNDVFYRFTLTRKMMITLTHCGTNIETYMHLLDASGQLILHNDSYSAGGACSTFIRRELAAGTYYVVSEGYGVSGEIKTNISGYVDEYGYTEPPPASVSIDPEAVGGAGTAKGLTICRMPSFLTGSGWRMTANAAYPKEISGRCIIPKTTR
jgi:hypothetical protein